MLLGLRVALGLASGGLAAASIGMVGRLFVGSVRARAMGYVTSALTVAGMVTPLLGGWVGMLGWRWAFLLYGVAFPVAIAARIWVREPLARTSAVDLSRAGHLRTLLARPAVMLALLGIAATSALFYTAIVYGPLYFAAVLGIGPALNGAILAGRGVGAAAIAPLASRLARHAGPGRAIAAGLALMAGTAWAIPSAPTPGAALVGALAFGAGMGMAMPTLYDRLAAIAPDDLRSSLLAVGAGVAALGQFLSPLCLGPVWKASGPAVFSWAAAGAIAVAIAFWLQRDRLQTETSERSDSVASSK